MDVSQLPDPLVHGFLEEWPEGTESLASIRIDGMEYEFTGWLPNRVRIGNAERSFQQEEGRNVATIARAIADGGADDEVQRFDAKLRAMLQEHGIETHSTRVIALDASKDGYVVPTMEFEATEIDDALMPVIVTYRACADGMPRGRKDLGTATLDGLSDWCEAQSELRALRNEPGITVDPMLAHLCGEDALSKIVELLRRTPKCNANPSGRAKWPRAQLEQAGIAVPPELRQLSIRGGRIYSEMVLGGELSWDAWTIDSKLRTGSVRVTLRRSLPEAVIRALPGKPLIDVVQCGGIHPSWTIISAKDSNILQGSIQLEVTGVRYPAVRDILPMKEGSEDQETKGKAT